MFLNHFFVVVDPATYAAARSSPFMTRDFAPFEARTTVRNDMTYTGIYWYGRHTYFELFEPGSQGPEGASGVALGVEEQGASAAVRRRWQEVHGRPPTDDVQVDDAVHLDAAVRLKDSSTPERELMRQEIERTVFETVEALPEELRQAITLREVDGLSYEEIAESMNCPIGTVRSRIFRAREAIDEKLRPLLSDGAHEPE